MATVNGRTPNLHEIRAAFHGNVVASGDPGYEDARTVWNGMIDRHPLAVVRVADLDDVRAGVAIARDRGLPLAIRGGGHNVAGNSTVEDGLVLDLGDLKMIGVDPEARLVRVGAGATLGDIDRATAPHGLVVPMGVVSRTGIAGLTLGGGFGWLVREYGLTVDNLVAVDVVSASGELLRASGTENADLFWGLKGGGGNFGVATTFTFQAHPLGPEVFAGTFVYERRHWVDALRAFRDWTAHLDDRMTSIVTFLVPPPEFEMGDQVLMLIAFAWAGPDQADGERTVAPLRTGAPPDVELLEPTRWVDWQSASDSFLLKGVRAYWKNAFFKGFGEELQEALIEHAGAQTWLGTGADFHHMGGAFGRVAEGDTPFPNRSAGYWLNIYGFWADQADDSHHTAWVKGLHAATAPHSMAGAYVNAFAQDRGADARDQALAIYGAAKLDRLVELKRRYDPGNLFRLNHNIPPN
jgi:FAD/FMN-containing dehydrogenase